MSTLENLMGAWGCYWMLSKMYEGVCEQWDSTTVAEHDEDTDDVWSGPQSVIFKVRGTFSEPQRHIFLPQCAEAHVSLKAPVVVSNIFLTEYNDSHVHELSFQIEIDLPIDPVVFKPGVRDRPKCVTVYDRKYAIERAKTFELSYRVNRNTLMEMCVEIVDTDDDMCGHMLCERESRLVRYYLQKEAYHEQNNCDMRVREHMEDGVMVEQYIISKTDAKSAVDTLMIWASSLKPVRLMALSVVVQTELPTETPARSSSDGSDSNTDSNVVTTTTTVAEQNQDTQLQTTSSRGDAGVGQQSERINPALRMANVDEADHQHERVQATGVVREEVNELFCKVEIVFEYV